MLSLKLFFLESIVGGIVIKCEWETVLKDWTLPESLSLVSLSALQINSETVGCSILYKLPLRASSYKKNKWSCDRFTLITEYNNLTTEYFLTHSACICKLASPEPEGYKRVFAFQGAKRISLLSNKPHEVFIYSDFTTAIAYSLVYLIPALNVFTSFKLLSLQ